MSTNKIVFAEHYWVILAMEYIIYPKKCQSGYPPLSPLLLEKFILPDNNISIILNEGVFLK